MSLPQPRVPGGSTLGWILITGRILIAVSSWIFRWFAGRPILGRADWRPTDATFLRRGYRRFPGHESDRLTFWAYLPEALRSLIRQVLLTLTVTAPWIYQWATHHPLLTWGTLALVTLILIRVTWRWWRMRTFRHTYVAPLAKTARTLLKIPPYLRTSAWLTISPEVPGLYPALVKPMGPLQRRIREWYGEHLEPVIRYVPDRVMRAWWWLTGRYAPLARKWREVNK